MSFEDTQATGDAAIKKLNGVIGRITSKLSPEELRQQNAEASRYQREAEGAIRKLETIAKDSPPTSRRGQMETISSLKASLNRARTDLQRSNDNAARGELLNKGDMKKKMEAEAIDKLAGAADKASSGTNKLQQASQVLQETQDIGVGVLDTMTQQRESLIRSRDKVGSTNSLTEKAKGIMRMMQARAITNKALLIFVVLVLLGLIGVVTYFGYVKDPKPS